jgi:UPF0755 protein
MADNVQEIQERWLPRWSFTKFLVTVFLYACAACVVGVAGVALLAFLVYDHVTQPGIPGPEVNLEVTSGMTLRDVGDMLTDKGLLEHEGFLRLASRVDRQNGTIQAGQYVVPEGLSALEYLHLLYDGPTSYLLGDQFKLTIPEGLSIPQVAERFKQPQAFVEAASNPDLIAELGINAPNLEGFLMPDTYFFDEEPTPEEAVARMVEHFQTTYDQLKTEIPGAEDQDLLEVVTVASLVEEEARVDDERGLVAAVIYNRLDKGMRLDMDSTLQFALNKYGQRLLNEDKEVDSPYNTYRRAGLPPTPISSPGAASLRFVSNADGTTHTFSRTLTEHNRAVAKFRREIAEQRRAQ